MRNTKTSTCTCTRTGTDPPAHIPFLGFAFNLLGFAADLLGFALISTVLPRVIRFPPVGSGFLLFPPVGSGWLRLPPVNSLTLHVLPYDPLVARGCYLMLTDVGRRGDQTMTDMVMRLRCTGVSMFDVDLAGYEHIPGGNPESKSASRPVCQDSNVWDPVAGIEVTGRWVACELAPGSRPAGKAGSRKATTRRQAAGSR